MDRALDVTVGRLRRAVMRLMNPATLAERSSALWASFHTHGRMEIVWRRPTSARVALVGHPFARSRLGRLTFAEMVRYTMALSRVREVTQRHAFEAPESVVVTLAWQ